MNVDERAEVAQQFGVAPEQVERDHLISHLPAFFSQNLGERIHFIGGTALARTHLPDGRLSEDIDLIAIDDRKAVAVDLDAVLPRAVAQTHGRLILDLPLSGVADTAAATGLVIRIQLLSTRGGVLWPTERRRLQQRYRDAPAAELIVPTPAAFAASKTATWADRRAPRDLWDPSALTRVGAIDAAAREMYRRFGPTNQTPGLYVFETPPSEAEWQSQLARQTRLTVDAADALAVVREAWARVVAAEDDDA